jgi:hypothetical protein
MLSGETMNHVIPLSGGCGGPYVLQVIEGQMPDGLYLDDDTHAIMGNVLEDGEFAFTIQVTDAGCNPFSSTTAAFRMSVGVGEITVVGATQDGNPFLIPAGAEAYNPDHAALRSVVYNDYVTIELIIAGGKGPYSAVVVDDPAIPNDGPLPLGASIPPSSASITGAPVEVGPEGGPFLVTLRITDSIGGTANFSFYWLVDTPAIIFATEALSDGQAGATYSDQIFVAEGVPPFVFEFVEDGLPADYTSDKSTNPGLDPNTDVIYNPGSPPTVTPATALQKIDASAYPSPADLGPGYDVSHQGVPPEGMVLYEDSGSLSGIPRRRGTFSVNAHVQSSLVPNSFGQHAWGTLQFSIAASGPIVHDPGYTLDPAFTLVKPYARLQEASKGETYNPDGGPNGLQLAATGGVPDDGLTDAPHASQASTDPLETPGAFKWTIDWNPDSDPGFGPIPGMELTNGGVFRIVEDGAGNPLSDDLIPQFDQSLAFTATDSALPTQLASDRAEKVAFGIGPDRILVTQSTTTMANSTDNRNWDDSAMTLKYVIPQGASYLMRAPATGDLTGDGANKHDLPPEAGSSTTPATLFTSIDLLRVSVNPTTYFDDNMHLNPNAARPWQNSQTSYYYPYYGPGSHGTTSYSSGTNTYGFQPATSCVRLPTCKDTGVAEIKGEGVYTSGGKLHVFDTSTHFGVLIVRADGRLYVPAAFQKSSSGYVSFGDNWGYGYRASGTTHSATRIPQMTVSPDGRIAAFKLRTSTTYYQWELASTTDILLVSLTGERIAAWDDEVYKIIATGSSGSSSEGQYLFASSLTLTNGYLYYLVGSGSTSYLHYKDHYIYRYGLFGGNTDADEGELLHSNFNSEWTNSAGNAMQTPFQQFNRNMSYSTSTGAPDPSMYGTNGYNSWESSLAPHPFRVNSEGNACAILAGRTTTATSAASDVLFHHVWVDYEGDLHQLSTQRRHTSGGGRGMALCHGPCQTPVAALWGAYNGPTSRFEISDDGLKVAVVYFRNTTVDPYVTYSEYQYRYREDISAYVSTDSAWSGSTVHEITGDTGTGTGYYTSPVYGKFPGSSSSSDHVWRFGALNFTMAGDGLVFYGGYSNEDPDNYYMYYNYQENGAKSFVGTLYSYDFATGGVRNILPSTIGGSNDTVGVAQTSITFSETAWSRDGGVIKPIGGWRSQDGNFMYIVTRGAVNSSDYRDGTLIGVNVRTVNATSSSTGSSTVAINGHQDGRAFRVDGLASTNGFLGTQYYAAYLGFMYTYSSRYDQYYFQIGDPQRVAAMDNGIVYTTSCTTSGSASSSTTYYYGGCINTTYYAYPYQKKVIYVFDANVGGDFQVVGGSGWTGSNYQHVQGLVVSDDGSALLAVDSTSSTYHYHYQERLTLFSGIELEADGDLPTGALTRQIFESGTCVGDCAAFSPKLDAIYYAADGGTGSTQMKLKKGTIGGGTTGAELGFSTARWSVLHVGR